MREQRDDQERREDFDGVERDWGVWCEVSGGFMGYCASWLKVGSDSIQWYGTQEEAEAKAAKENARVGSPHSTASFRYTAQLVY